MLIAIILVNSIFLTRFVYDLYQNYAMYQREEGNNLLLICSSPIIFFLSTFGISDFAISSILYRKKKLLPDHLLPGTLNTQCVIPVAAMALSFITVIRVDMITLVTCILSQVAGAYCGPRFITRFSARTIRICIGAGLFVAAIFVAAGLFHLIPSAGTATKLAGFKLVIAAVCLFLFGILNNIGIGSYAPTMVTIYALGLNPGVAFPIMMGASTFAVPIGSMQIIKYGNYSRKITLFAATLGLLGALLGVLFINRLDLSMLQWLVAVILLYSSMTIFVNEARISC
jgi:uncharacterized membrane protein YfcA